MEALKEINNSKSSPIGLGKRSFFSPVPVQTKLQVNLPEDKYEVEADQVADQIVQRLPESDSYAQSYNQNSTHQKPENNSPVQAKCDACEAEELENPKEKEIQRKPENQNSFKSFGEEDPKVSTWVTKQKNTVPPTVSSETTAQLYTSKGGGNPLPKNTQSEMEQEFGIDFSNVRTHTGPSAVIMSKNLGAQAFTHGSDIYFNSGKFDTQSRRGKKLLAHELTHVVQQGGNTGTIQRYAIVGGERVSDDGKMVVDDHTKNAWALESDIDKSNAIFSNINSERSLNKTASKRKVKVPGGTTEHKLTKYEVDVPNLIKNCGRAALQMLGHNVTGEREYVGVTNKGTTQEFTKTIGYHGDDQAPGGVLSTTEELSTEIYQKIFLEQEGKTLTRSQALTEWDNLSIAKKEKYSKIYGINEFAVPKVGQAITMGTEFDMPGFKNDSQLGRSNSTWNFHFGTPVITSGHDYTTAENFTGSSHDYYFSMFGSHTKNQSWFDEQKGAGFGNKHTAMVVQHPETLTGETSTNNVKLVSSPEKYVKDGSGVITHLSSGTGVKIVRKGTNWMKVEVTSGGDTGKMGWMMNKYFKDV